MEQKPKSEGICYFCGKIFAKTGINCHLKTHLQKKAIEKTEGTSFLVKIESNPQWGSAPYFLSLWIDGEATMNHIDTFLRDIWLECCGHMSAFRNPQFQQQVGGMWDYFEAMELLEKGKVKQYEKMMEDMSGEVPKSRKANKVFYKDLKLEYEYDFGSSTELLLTVMEEYPVKADKKIVLLSRNEPLEWLCDTCKKEPATQICTAHEWDEESLFCDKCGKKHAKICEDFRDYSAMPMVNSPRMGVCAYEGGRIDTERDGIFVKNKRL
ncbi:hypothetical protein SDC9_112500 [bioreactor metagenome]|uniref:C2H2-type domain-containing protein n=1 Tax=bioreactor metagenome TaxID=1076179 RepID=A0A645BQU9_9ZZZZ